jgi:hypothetical protein
VKVSTREGNGERQCLRLLCWFLGNFEKKENARVFPNIFITSNMVVTKIKEDAAMWCLAEAKALSNVML